MSSSGHHYQQQHSGAGGQRSGRGHNSGHGGSSSGASSSNAPGWTGSAAAGTADANRASMEEYAYNKVFVGGLHYDTRDAELCQYFERFGRIISSEVMFNRETHKSRGFGFVVFELEQSAELVCAQAEHTLDNKVVEIKRAIPRSKIAPGTSPTKEQAVPPPPSKALLTNTAASPQTAAAPTSSTLSFSKGGSTVTTAAAPTAAATSLHTLLNPPVASASSSSSSSTHASAAALSSEASTAAVASGNEKEGSADRLTSKSSISTGGHGTKVHAPRTSQNRVVSFF